MEKTNKLYYVEIPTLLMKRYAIIATDEEDLKKRSQEMVDKFKQSEFNYKIEKTKDKIPVPKFHKLSEDWQMPRK